MNQMKVVVLLWAMWVLVCFVISQAHASSEVITFQKYGYQILQDEGEGTPVATPSHTPPATPPRTPLRINTSNRTLVRSPDYHVLSKTLQDKDFLKDFDSEIPTFFYRAGLNLEDFMELRTLSVRSDYLNRLKFQRIIPSYQFSHAKEVMKIRVDGFEVEFYQNEMQLVFGFPGEALKSLMQSAMKTYFENKDPTQDTLLFKIRLVSPALDDSVFMIDLVIPIRFH